MKHFFIYNKQFLFDKYLKEHVLNLTSTYSWNVFKSKNTNKALLHDTQLHSYVFYNQINVFDNENLELYDIEQPLDVDSFNIIATFTGLKTANDIRTYVYQAYGDDLMLSMISIGQCSGSSIMNILQNQFKIFYSDGQDLLSSNYIYENVVDEHEIV